VIIIVIIVIAIIVIIVLVRRRRALGGSSPAAAKKFNSLQDEDLEDKSDSFSQELSLSSSGRSPVLEDSAKPVLLDDKNAKVGSTRAPDFEASFPDAFPTTTL